MPVPARPTPSLLRSAVTGLALMCAVLAADLQCDLNRVNVKATTTEQLGFTGRKEGIATEAVVLLVKQ